MSASQDGRTPRRATRRSTATPVRDVSPPARNTRGASTAVQGTPATRRSARASSRKPDQPTAVTSNEALPEIQTRQSYAYGSSKTPLLPEQLHVGEKQSMKQVTDRMESAINRATQNLNAHGADIIEDSRQSQIQPVIPQTNRRTSKEASPPASVTTEVQKKQRTAAWASSLDSGQLDDILEEEQPEIDTPETRRTDPSSFPSGVFDHSYQYERGARPPRKPPKAGRTSIGSKFGALLDRSISTLKQVQKSILELSRGVAQWLARLFRSILSILLELPESRLVSILTKTFAVLAVLGLLNYAICFGYTRYMCNPSSTSKSSQIIESWCGNCQSARNYIDLPPGSENDVRKLTSALKHIDTQIRNIESRLNSRLDNTISALNVDMDNLRKEQSNLVDQLEHVANRAAQQTSSSDVASPLIPKINYFSPANGAIVNVHITSPTRRAPIALPLRVLTGFLGIHKYKAHNPVAALEPWHDVGDCWCAAASGQGQDSIRLGVGVREYIYPTELVIEHPPREVSLTPETAPRRIELWADFGHLPDHQWNELGIESLSRDPDGRKNPFGSTWGMIANVEYEMASRAAHLQTFILDVNQFGELKYSANDFAVRVRSTYGAEYGCLYRVRLHGIPVEKHEDVFAASGRNSWE